MKKLVFTALLGGLVLHLFSQQPIVPNPPDTNPVPKRAGVIELREIVVSASRADQKLNQMPARAEVIGKAMIESYPAFTADDILNAISGANIDREFGIFTKNASITMRGMNSAQRTLVLLDGTPLNKTDGGSINWNRIDPDQIERIEVIKGPVSALYGGNGMAGVINIITRKPETPFGGNIRLFYGDFNTTGVKASVYGDRSKNGKGFYGSMNCYYRQGDGFYLYPEASRDSTDVPNKMKEGTLSMKAGYKFKPGLTAEIEYSYYDDKRSDGVLIYDPDGGYTKYTTNWLRARLRGVQEKLSWEVNAFYQAENFHQQKESLKKDALPPYAVTKYQLYDALYNRFDQGIWTNITRKAGNYHTLTAGLDLKSGNVNSSDVYYTSTDKVNNTGRMNFAAIFMQDEMLFLKKQLRLTAGLRLDYVQFREGSFDIEDPSATTEILVPYTGEFAEDQWPALSPKLAARYEFNAKSSAYVSFGRGFRPPILDDMCRNGNITKGLKLANPGLKPEKLDNYEMGADIGLGEHILLQPSIFYSKGTDFQYFVGTGDSIYSGNKPKPVLRRENIGNIQIFGQEIGLRVQVTRNLVFLANYAHYDSEITKFALTGYVAKDLTGKQLMEVAPNQFNASLTWKSRLISAGVFYHYTDSQFIDDENTISSPSHSILDVKLYRDFSRHINMNLGVQNILNTNYIDEKGQQSIGRFIMFGAAYTF